MHSERTFLHNHRPFNRFFAFIFIVCIPVVAITPRMWVKLNIQQKKKNRKPSDQAFEQNVVKKLVGTVAFVISFRTDEIKFYRSAFWILRYYKISFLFCFWEIENQSWLTREKDNFVILFLFLLCWTLHKRIVIGLNGLSVSVSRR